MYIPSRFLFFIFHWHLNLQQLKISKIGKYARCFNRSNCRDSAFNELINISWSPYIYAYTGDVHKYIYIYIIHISYIYIYNIYIYIYIYIYISRVLKAPGAELLQKCLWCDEWTKNILFSSEQILHIIFYLHWRWCNRFCIFILVISCGEVISVYIQKSVVLVSIYSYMFDRKTEVAIY